METYVKNTETGEVRIKDKLEMIISPWIIISEDEYIETKNQKKMKLLCEDCEIPHLKIDNYLENTTRFYDTQPFFYDKAGIFWFWDKMNSKYVVVDDTDLMNSIDKNLKFFGQTITKGVKNNYLEAFKRFGRDKTPKDAPSKMIQFKDKAFSLSSGKVWTVTPDYFFTNPIPWELGKSEDTPTMDKLFTEWVGKGNVTLLYEIIAYSCYTDYPIHRIFCLVGSGSNGKSRYLALLEKFLGDNLCASELDDLINNRFESFKLYRKLCCVMGETNFGVLNKTSLLKKLSGQDIIGFEKKNKDPFNGHNYAKILISSNSLPVSEDNTDGFYRRWSIIDFPNQFPEGKDILETIPKEEYNNLARKCVRILKRLLETGAFTNQGEIKQRKEKYLLASNPLSIFLAERCELGEAFYCSYGELYTQYIKYLSDHKKRRIKSSDFKKALEDEGLWVEKTSKKENNEWVSGFWVNGVKVRDFCDNYDILSTPFYKKIDRIEKQSQMSQMSQTGQSSPSLNKANEEMLENINLPCHICGLTPSQAYDDSAQGKPICEFCYKDKKERGLI